MHIYLSHLDGLEKNPLKQASEAILMKLAYARGVRIAHNNAIVWQKLASVSIKKYCYQQSYKFVWEKTYRLSRQIIQNLDWVFDCDLEQLVFENALASALFRPVFDDCIFNSLTMKYGPCVEKWPSSSKSVIQHAFVLSRIFYMQKRLLYRSNGTLIEPSRPNCSDKANWLVFSGHSPSKAILNILEYLDPEKTIAFVNFDYVNKSVIQTLDEKQIRCHPVHWNFNYKDKEVKCLFDRLRWSIKKINYPLLGMAHMEELVKMAYWWVVYTGTVKAMKIPFKPGDRLITGNDRNLHMAAFVLEAQRNGADTITLQDGVFGDTEHITTFPSQRIGVLGERYRKFYIEAGRKEGSIVNIGHKGWSGIDVVPVDQKLKRKLFHTSKKVALFCTQYYPVSDLETYDMLACCLKVFDKRSDWAFFIKPHPHYPIDHILNLIPGARDHKIEGPIEPLLMACDCNLALHSTTLIEAALLGRKSAAVNLAGLKDLCFSADGIAVCELTSAEEIDRFLDDSTSFDHDAYRTQYARRFDEAAVAALLN